MTLPKEVVERVILVSDHEQDRLAGKLPDDRAGAPAECGWRMPGGEDLLNFALSAGFPAAAWWLGQNRKAAEDKPAEEPSEAAIARKDR